ncbi:MAG TPA: hypothetical protein P5550_03230 [Bacteroidales bacterium]|nr:hypothetical protein [Bacteroidales bacterium]HRZ75982.1 hypothetical protein [Bacteroidales bacterium]
MDDHAFPLYARPALLKGEIPSEGLGSRWQSPSNIALVKYWGKHGDQLPANASVSLTLEKSHTITRVNLKPGHGRLRFFLDEKEQPLFQQRLQKTLQGWKGSLPFLASADLEIHSSNSFPHSAGIASSASAMSALALCLVDLEHQLGGDLSEKERLDKASYLARLGSGSASRSVYPFAAVWGKTTTLPGSGPLKAVPAPLIHPVFKGMKDSILIVDPGVKAVSSSAGHRLMEGHPFARQRFEQADAHTAEMVSILGSGDLEAFLRIVEQEALTLHGLMMSSVPGYLLLRPGTLEIIRILRDFREQNHVPLCFTLDAGPNVHLLYPETDGNKVRTLIDEMLLPWCHQGSVIHDETGAGPRPLT